jgi:rare lipoprotein A
MDNKSLITILLVVALAAGCSTAPSRNGEISRAEKPQTPPAATTTAKGGGYYMDDGPGDNPPENLDAIPDAEPHAEPLHRFANRPYTVLGQTYTPDTRIEPYKARGMASWYGRKFHGQKTSSGELYNMYGMTAAHPTLPIPSYARVTNLANNKSVVVRINDRGPFHSDRLIDLSYTAAYKLGIVQRGSGMVQVESIDPENYSPSDTTVAQTEAPSVATAAADPPKAAPQAPLETEAAGVYLQLGAFSGQDNAQNFYAKIRQQLGTLADALHIFPRNGLFRVHLGPYRDRSEALAVADRLRQSLDISPMIVSR